MMEIIIERFGMERICSELTQEGYFFVSGVGNDRKAKLKFIKRIKEETDKLCRSSNLADIFAGLYGEV